MGLESKFEKFEDLVGLDNEGLTCLCVLNAETFGQCGNGFMYVCAYVLAGGIAYTALSNAFQLWDAYLNTK